MAYWYPQSALEGFASAVGATLGVTFKMATGQPRTDGKTVWLPQITGLLSEDEFKGLCGTAIHEAAHVYFKSVPHHIKFSGKDKLRALVFNVVLDLADETRIEECLPSSDSLLRTGSVNILKKWKADDVLALGKHDPAWQVLCGVLMSLRVTPYGNQEIADNLKWVETSVDAVLAQHPHPTLGVMHRYDIRSAMEGATNYWVSRRSKRRGPRTPHVWKRVVAIAEAVYQMVKHFPQPSKSGTDHGHGQGQGVPQPGNGTSIIDAMNPNHPGNGGQPGKIANFQDGKDVAASGKGKGQTQPQPGQGQPGGGAGYGPSGTQFGAASSPEEQLYRDLKTCVGNTVRRMAEAQHADGSERGYTSGPRFGSDISRALIDGQCFARKRAEGERLSVAIVLDKSGSMVGSIREVAAVAEAFSESVESVCDNVYRATFNSDVQAVMNFRGVCSGGNTETGKAIAWAISQLSGDDGRRVIICITDGKPGDENRLHREMQKARSLGIQTLAIGYGQGITPNALFKTMPGAAIAHANNAIMLACSLSRAADQILAVEA